MPENSTFSHDRSIWLRGAVDMYPRGRKVGSVESCFSQDFSCLS